MVPGWAAGFGLQVTAVELDQWTSTPRGAEELACNIEALSGEKAATIKSKPAGKREVVQVATRFRPCGGTAWSRQRVVKPKGLTMPNLTSPETAWAEETTTLGETTAVKVTVEPTGTSAGPLMVVVDCTDARALLQRNVTYTAVGNTVAQSLLGQAFDRLAVAATEPGAPV
jgi:hypothetical protein